VGAVLFVIAIYFIKNGIPFLSSKENNTAISSGLNYDNALIENIVARDTDGDGVLDWEESLWGTDPTKADTDGNGTPDSTEIAALKSEMGQNKQPSAAEEKLTKTDEFSRQLFSTVAALNQTGAMDQATVDKISESLANEIQNRTPKKIYVMADIKTVNTKALQDIKNYASKLGALFNKYRTNIDVPSILSKSMTADGDIDMATLNRIDPYIKNMQAIVEGMLKIEVPFELAPIHLSTLNSFERVVENLSDVKLVDTDTIVAMGAISQYQDNDDTLASDIAKLVATLNEKSND
jgi:hypothetical protein